jgi:hypothetical protein
VDLEESPYAAAQVRWLTGGYASHPTVSVAGEVLVEPGLGELEWALARAGLLERLGDRLRPAPGSVPRPRAGPGSPWRAGAGQRAGPDRPAASPAPEGTVEGEYREV